MPVVPMPPIGEGLQYIRCGTLIDGTGSAPQKGVTIVVEDDVISEILPGYPDVPEGATLLDASAQTVMPGLMDLHVHLVSVIDPEEPNAMTSMMLSTPHLLTLWAARNAELMINAGFTTVRDLAGYMNWKGHEVVAVRKAIQTGIATGPRIYAAGWVSQTAGHADLGLPPTWPRDPNDRADGPWAIRRQVRDLIRNGVDLIKTSSSAGGGDYIAEVWWRNHTHEELEAMADEIHAVGKKLAIHAHTAETIAAAIAGGADTIEHGTFATDESLALMAERGIFLTPTLSVRSERGVAGRMSGAAHPHILRKSRQMRKSEPDVFARARKAGVKIVCGTDTFLALREHWGENAFELELMVRQGMSPLEAITAATSVSAEAIGIDKQVGTLTAEKWADLLVVDGDPLEDIRLLQDLSRMKVVMKAGQIAVDRRGDMSATPA
jgi:imidazolonepropionase-like amidohydrolase